MLEMVISNLGGRLSRSGCLLALALLAASSLVACGDSGGASASNEVVLYTSMPDSVVDRLKGVIEQRFPDLEGNVWMPMDESISLRVVRGRTADIELLIANEISSGDFEADLIWLAEPSPYEAYKDMGLLAPYQPPAGTPILSRYIDPDGFFVAGRLIAMVLAWNTALLPEGLTDWPDLLEVDQAAFPGTGSGAARATIKALLDRYGQDYFATFAEGGGMAVASNGDARDGVVDGTLQAVAVLDYMARKAKASGSSIDFAYPSGGTVLIPSPIAITASAPNPTDAKAVVDFILSAPGQEILVQIGDFYSVRGDVEPPVGATALDDITTLTVDWRALSSEIEQVNSLWAELFGDT